MLYSKILSGSLVDITTDLKNILKQKVEFNPSLNAKVSKIIEEVAVEGWKAVARHSKEFDSFNVARPEDLLVTEEEIAKSVKSLPKDLLAALQHSIERVISYHEKQKAEIIDSHDPSRNLVDCSGYRFSPIEKVGVYAPGGTAVYPSSVIMAAIPAKVAGASEVVLCTPARNGVVAPVIMAAAHLCGIEKIYKIGGATAIASMAFGLEGLIEKSDIIVGPGNSYVAAAKKLVYGQVGIDSIAGPTDITIIAQDLNEKQARYIAWDLLAQAEHGKDSRVILITDNSELISKVQKEIKAILDVPSEAVKARVDIIETSLKDNALFIKLDNIVDAADLANIIAPEHLHISTKDDEALVGKIKNAGAIFMGAGCCEALGDYILGPSHVLPTAGSSRWSSGISILTFTKISSVSRISRSTDKILESASMIAEFEELPCHKESLVVRRNI